VERDKPKQSESVGQNGHHFKMAANIKIKKIKINSKKKERKKERRRRIITRYDMI
jgi:hypothetical protein